MTHFWNSGTPIISRSISIREYINTELSRTVLMSKLRTAGAERLPVVVCCNSPCVTPAVPSHIVCRASVVSMATGDASFDVDVTGIEVVVTCGETFVDALVTNWPATEWVAAAVVIETTGENDKDTDVSATRVLADDVRWSTGVERTVVAADDCLLEAELTEVDFEEYVELEDATVVGDIFLLSADV